MHDAPQAPLEQTWPFTQAVPPLPAPPTPHPFVAPQCVGSLVGSTHVPLQFTSVPGHDTAHVPPLHTSPFLHAVPALPVPPMPQPGVAPQRDGSVIGLTHVLPHCRSPPAQPVAPSLVGVRTSGAEPSIAGALPFCQHLPSAAQ